MSKRIDSTLTALIKALVKHGEIVGGSHGSVKKTQRASAKVREAAAAYAEAVEKRTGQPNLFEALAGTGLDDETVRSLEAERDAIKGKS